MPRNSRRRGTVILTDIPAADRYAKEVLASRTGCVDRTPGAECSVLYLNNTIVRGIWNEQHKCIVPNVDNHPKTFCPNPICVTLTAILSAKIIRANIGLTYLRVLRRTSPRITYTILTVS